MTSTPIAGVENSHGTGGGEDGTEGSGKARDDERSWKPTPKKRESFAARRRRSRNVVTASEQQGSSGGERDACVLWGRSGASASVGFVDGGMCGECVSPTGTASGSTPSGGVGVSLGIEEQLEFVRARLCVVVGEKISLEVRESSVDTDSLLSS